MSDPFDLNRFVAAQAPVHAQVCEELATGRKTSHWMWFVFPQLEALGRSATAKHYGIASQDEARGYWQHALLGPRLVHCTSLVCQVSGRSAHDIFGSPDDLKFRSCLTLFHAVAPHEPIFAQALHQYFDGAGDQATLRWLAEH